MTIMDNINEWVEDRLQSALAGLDFMNDARVATMKKARAYRKGAQPKTIRTKEGQTDDNLKVNFIGLVVNRAIALLFGEGVEFDLPGEGETEVSKYIEQVWDVNKKHELLHDTADYGATGGTPCWKIRPNAIIKDGI